MIHVLVWYENMPDADIAQKVEEIYPGGIHVALKALFDAEPDMETRAATLQDEAQGLSQEALDWADVLVYWSHKHAAEVEDEAVERIRQRVLDGMGLICLHSAHASKVLQRTLATRTRCLRWREADELQRVWLVAPGHPIAEGLEREFFEIPQDETYGEFFEIPQPDEQVFITWSQGGEVLRSGNCWRRGAGRIFYFSSGHETYPVYHQREVRIVLRNAVRWAAQRMRRPDWPMRARQSAPANGR